jgi:hypothetical protein
VSPNERSERSERALVIVAANVQLEHRVWLELGQTTHALRDELFPDGMPAPDASVSATARQRLYKSEVWRIADGASARAYAARKYCKSGKGGRTAIRAHLRDWEAYAALPPADRNLLRIKLCAEDWYLDACARERRSRHYCYWSDNEEHADKYRAESMQTYTPPPVDDVAQLVAERRERADWWDQNSPPTGQRNVSEARAEFIANGNEDQMRALEQVKTRTRKLTQALEKVGCMLRGDSRLCESYIQHGVGNVDEIAETMEETAWLAHTSYHAQMQARMHKKGHWLGYIDRDIGDPYRFGSCVRKEMQGDRDCCSAAVKHAIARVYAQDLATGRLADLEGLPAALQRRVCAVQESALERKKPEVPRSAPTAPASAHTYTDATNVTVVDPDAVRARWQEVTWLPPWTCQKSPSAATAMTSIAGWTLLSSARCLWARARTWCRHYTSGSVRMLAAAWGKLASKRSICLHRGARMSRLLCQRGGRWCRKGQA